jgi:hypothetical protein
MNTLEVPFYANTPDDTHCFQAALRSVLGYFQPEEVYSWEQLDAITGKKPGMWTWAMSGLLWLQQQGFAVKNIEEFDYEAFSKSGEDYLINTYGVDVAQQQAKHAVLEDEQRIAQKFIKQIDHETRLPTFNEIGRLLAENFVLIANVNSKSLNNEPGFVGHYVVIIGCDEESITLHDPGLPAVEGRRVTHEQFRRGWDFPDKHRRNLMAIGVE